MDGRMAKNAARKQQGMGRKMLGTKKKNGGQKKSILTG